MNLFCKLAVSVYVTCIVQGFAIKIHLPPCKDHPIWSFCPETSRKCFCCEIYQKAVCSNFGKNLTFIPSLPAYVTQLTFDGNNLMSVTNYTFQNLTNLNLMYFSLSMNCIRWISKDAFSQLKHLKKLDLSNNYPMYNHMGTTLAAIAETEVNEIHLDDINFVIRDTEFQILNKSKISIMSLTNNKFEKFNGYAISKLPVLKELNMSENDISVFRLHTPLRKLGILDLSNNRLKLDEKTPFCIVRKKRCLSNVPLLFKLFLSNNLIERIQTDTFKCFHGVKYLHLSKNPIVTLSNYIFKPLTSLDRLHLRELYHLKNLENGVFANSTFKSLTFSTRKTFIEKICRGKSIFRYCKNLISLELSGTPIPRPYKQLNKLFSPLRNLKCLRLTDVKLNTLPKYVFSKFLKLEELKLDGNRIRSWRGREVFGNLTSLRILNLDDNKIGIIKENFFTEQLLKSLTILSFGNNPLQCTCENKWLRDFIRKHNGKDIKVLNFNHYKCSGNSLFKTYNPTVGDCTVVDYVFLSVGTVSAILVIFLLTSGIAYKMRWHIRYRLYLIRNYKDGYQKIPSVSSSKYGAYVIYSNAEKDRLWVHKELIPRLEKKRNIKLCIRMRDFVAGGVIMDAMVESLMQSNKAILVLSNNFAKCDWCKFQLTVLHNRLMTEGRSILLLVNFKTIYVDNMNEYLHWLITTNKHFDWSKEKVAKQLFWEQLVTSLNLPNENHCRDFQNETHIPNPLTKSYAARPCTIL